MYPAQQPVIRLGVPLRTGVRLQAVRYRKFAAGFVEFVESDGWDEWSDAQSTGLNIISRNRVYGSHGREDGIGGSFR